MSSAFTVARKELRGLFTSPVAIIFLGVFLTVTLFTFFSWSRFFARNLMTHLGLASQYPS